MMKTLFYFIVMFFFSCNKMEEKKDWSKLSRNSEEYNIVLDYLNYSKDESIKGNFVYVFFEEGFENDSVLLKFNSKEIFFGTINTDHSLGYADSFLLGKLSEAKEISFKINNGRDVILRNIDYNSLKINYIKDTLVQVSFSNKFIAYK